MIEEKLTIDFNELVSCFDDDGEIKDGFVENAQCCIDAINKSINNFLSGVTTIAHQGFNVYGCNFHAKVNISVGENIVSLKIVCDGFSGNLAEYIFEPTTDLVMNKSYNLVSIK